MYVKNKQSKIPSLQYNLVYASATEITPNQK